MGMSTAFSWTCHPKRKALREQRTSALRSAHGSRGRFHSPHSAGCRDEIGLPRNWANWRTRLCYRLLHVKNRWIGSSHKTLHSFPFSSCELAGEHCWKRLSCYYNIERYFHWCRELTEFSKLNFRRCIHTACRSNNKQKRRPLGMLVRRYQLQLDSFLLKLASTSCGKLACIQHTTVSRIIGMGASHQLEEQGENKCTEWPHVWQEDEAGVLNQAGSGRHTSLCSRLGHQPYNKKCKFSFLFFFFNLLSETLF